MFLLFFHRLAGGELVFHGHHIDPIALPLLFFPAGAPNTELLQHAAVELLQFVFGAFVNNDPIGAAADDFVNGDLPGAQYAFAQEGDAQSSHHQGGELSCFDVEGKTQHPAQHAAGFGDHLAVDHPAVALGREGFAEGVDRVDQDHIPHLANPIQGHPAGKPRQKTGEGVVAQAKGHHFAAIDIHNHFSHHAKPAAGVAGDHLGAHQL